MFYAQELAVGCGITVSGLLVYFVFQFYDLMSRYLGISCSKRSHPFYGSSDANLMEKLL